MERIPTVLGFDPMMQFVHEEDVCEAIALALEHGLQGVFNVTGPARCRSTPRSARPAARAAAARVRCCARSIAPAVPPRPVPVPGGRARLHQVPGDALGPALRRGDATSGRSSASRRSSTACGAERWRRMAQGGLRAMLRDLAGALTPLAVRDLGAEIADRLRKVPTRVNEFGFDPTAWRSRRWARGAPAGAALPLLLPRRDLRHRADPAGRVLLISNHAGQLPFDATMLGVATLLEAEPPRIARGMGEYWIPQLPFVNWLATRAAAGRDARELRAAPRGRRVRDGLPGRRARHEQDCSASATSSSASARLHAPRARDGDADRAGRDRRLRGAAAGAREPRGARPRARHARLPDHADLPVARPARAPAAAGALPHPLRRAAALRRRLERRGRRDRGQGRGGARARSRRSSSAGARSGRGCSVDAARARARGARGAASLALRGPLGAARGAAPAPRERLAALPEAPGRPALLVFVSIAGLDAATAWRGAGRAMPTLARLAEPGVVAERVEPVAPASALPGARDARHGRAPREHGILADQRIGERGVRRERYWHASQLRARRLWQLAAESACPSPRSTGR